MNASFTQLLNTGALGGLTLGLDPASVEVLLGMPDDRSRKSNPLILKYGSLELAFTGARELPLKLIQMSLRYNEAQEPAPIVFVDWNPSRKTSISDFLNFTRDKVTITESLLGDQESVLKMRSGVQAYFTSKRLKLLQLSKRVVDRPLPPMLKREDAALLSRIDDSLHEAQVAMNAGLLSAALLVGWSVLEMALRYVALQAGMEGKVRTQPTALVRSLLSSGLISRNDARDVEELRLLRADAAHGTWAKPIDANAVRKLLAIIRRLVEEARG